MTARSEEGDVVAGLSLGADDYVTKPFSLSVLVARIEAVMRRRRSARAAQKGVLEGGPIRINQDTHSVHVAGKEVSLTLTEFRLLVALVAARGRVLTRDQLMDHGMGPHGGHGPHDRRAPGGPAAETRPRAPLHPDRPRRGL